MIRWSDDAWRASTLAWASDELRRIGRPAIGAADQFHLRPWSTIFRIPTREGNVYLKAVPGPLVHEVRLTTWLAARFPDRVLSVLAADAGRGLMLLPEGGTRLRDAGAALPVWERLAGEYADLQLLVAPHATELMALGVPDRGLGRLAAALAAVLPDERAIARYTALCTELAAVGVPETIQMDDLHDGNVFVDRDRLRVVDWGDASVTHPFVSLRMLLFTVSQRFADDPAAAPRVRDAYLEPFHAFRSLAVLRGAADLAARITPTVRMLAWQLAFADATAEERSTGLGETLEDLIEQQRVALGGGV